MVGDPTAVGMWEGEDTERLRDREGGVAEVADVLNLAVGSASQGFQDPIVREPREQKTRVLTARPSANLPNASEFKRLSLICLKSSRVSRNM